jgi:hypothetical protein
MQGIVWKPPDKGPIYTLLSSGMVTGALLALREEKGMEGEPGNWKFHLVK